ncbi:phage holin family protein [Streptomyces sp. NPDC015532]|uniref:phage holin family protein n=1 Tax=Streptomyces sp. NPDC015532 TaxID=3364960 RepID=UPI0036FC19EA
MVTTMAEPSASRIASYHLNHPAPCGGSRAADVGGAAVGSSEYPCLGFDPAPGDLETVRLMVSAIGRVNRDSGTAHTQLSKIGSSDGIWVGKSADAFSTSVEKIPPYLKKALDSVGSAHRALSNWETSLDGFQSRARKLEEEAAAAAKKVSSAKGALHGLPDDTSALSEREKDEHEKDKKSKQKACDEANSELEAVRGRAHSLHTEYTTVADATARTIKDAADDAPPEPGWFDDLVDGFTDFLSDAWDVLTDPNFWKLVGDVLADVAMVIGVICLVALALGTGVGALGLIGFIVGVGALAAHSAAMIGGAEGMTWQTLAWDALGVVAGGVGLAGARLARLGRVMVQSGRALRASEGFMATLGKIGPGAWGNIAKIPSGMGNSLRGFSMAGQGWVHVATGTTLDIVGTVTGAGFAIGSNTNEGRWLDGDWNISDVPVVGPIAGFASYEAPESEPRIMAPGPLGPQFDASTSLTSAGQSFTNALQPSSFGTAA